MFFLPLDNSLLRTYLPKIGIYSEDAFGGLSDLELVHFFPWLEDKI